MDSCQGGGRLSRFCGIWHLNWLHLSDTWNYQMLVSRTFIITDYMRVKYEVIQPLLWWKFGSSGNSILHCKGRKFGIPTLARFRLGHHDTQFRTAKLSAYVMFITFLYFRSKLRSSCFCWGAKSSTFMPWYYNINVGLPSFQQKQQEHAVGRR